MQKKGLIGKIFLVIGIIILIIIIILGLTALQGYKVYKAIITEQSKITEVAYSLNKDIESENISGACEKLQIIKESSGKIKLEVNSACKNPIMKLGINKIMANQQIPLSSGKITPSCTNIDVIYNEAIKHIKPIEDVCNNQTLMNQTYPLKDINAIAQDFYTSQV